MKRAVRERNSLFIQLNFVNNVEALRFVTVCIHRRLFDAVFRDGLSARMAVGFLASERHTICAVDASS